MFGHIPELIIILVLALIVFGPEKLPEVAHNAGKMMRELREVMDSAMNPVDVGVPDDFEAYYHESLARSGEEPPSLEDEDDVARYEYFEEPLEPPVDFVEEDYATVPDAGDEIENGHVVPGSGERARLENEPAEGEERGRSQPD